MGLELLELVLDIEDAFEISIPDEDATQLTTIKKLVDYVSERVEDQLAVGCATSAAFYAIRRTICDVSGVARNAVRPNSRWDELVDKREWRRVRAKLRERGIQLPRLHTPTSASLVVLFLAAASAAGAGKLTNSSFVMILSFLSTLVLGLSVSRAFAAQMPTGCATVGDSASYAAVRFDEKNNTRSLSRSDIDRKIRLIICEEFGIPMEELRDDFKLVELETGRTH